MPYVILDRRVGGVPSTAGNEGLEGQALIKTGNGPGEYSWDSASFVLKKIETPSVGGHPAPTRSGVEYDAVSSSWKFYHVTRQESFVKIDPIGLIGAVNLNALNMNQYTNVDAVSSVTENEVSLVSGSSSQANSTYEWTAAAVLEAMPTWTRGFEEFDIEIKTYSAISQACKHAYLNYDEYDFSNVCTVRAAISYPYSGSPTGSVHVALDTYDELRYSYDGELWTSKVLAYSTTPAFSNFSVPTPNSMRLLAGAILWGGDGYLPAGFGRNKPSLWRSSDPLTENPTLCTFDTDYSTEDIFVGAISTGVDALGEEMGVTLILHSGQVDIFRSTVASSGTSSVGLEWTKSTRSHSSLGKVTSIAFGYDETGAPVWIATGGNSIYISRDDAATFLLIKSSEVPSSDLEYDASVEFTSVFGGATTIVYGNGTWVLLGRGEGAFPYELPNTSYTGRRGMLVSEDAFSTVTNYRDCAYPWIVDAVTYSSDADAFIFGASNDQFPRREIGRDKISLLLTSPRHTPQDTEVHRQSMYSAEPGEDDYRIESGINNFKYPTTKVASIASEGGSLVSAPWMNLYYYQGRVHGVIGTLTDGTDYRSSHVATPKITLNLPKITLI